MYKNVCFFLGSATVSLRLETKDKQPFSNAFPKKASRSLMKRRYMHCMRRTPTNCWPGKWTSTEASRKLCQQQILAHQRLWPHFLLHSLNLTLKSDQKVSCLYLSLHVSFHLGPPPPSVQTSTFRWWHANAIRATNNSSYRFAMWTNCKKKSPT